MTPSKPTESTITVHTDGACKGNPGPGSWGVVIEDEHQRLCFAGRVSDTTNQQMELTAAIKALEALSKHAGRPIRLVTDSTYLVKGMTEWMEKWKANGWRGTNRKPVGNQDLWLQLDALNQKHSISWEWVMTAMLAMRWQTVWPIGQCVRASLRREATPGGR